MKSFVVYYFACWYVHIILSKAILLESSGIGASNHALKSYKGEIIVDVVKAKSLENIVLIFDDKNMEEMIQVTSSLQSTMINFTCTFILVKDTYQLYDTYHDDNFDLYIENVAKLVMKKQETFTYFIQHYHSISFLAAIRKYDKVSKVILMTDVYYLFPYFVGPSKRLARTFTNIYMFQPGSQKLPATVYHLFGVCKYCGIDFDGSYGRAKTVYLNRWESLKGFEFPLEFIPSFQNNFHKKRLLLNVQLHPTTIFNIKNEKYLYEGPLYDDLMILGKKMNFTLGINEETVQCVSKDGDKPTDWDPSRRVRDPHKHIGDFELLETRIDMAGGDFIASHKVNKYADITAPTFYQSGANIVSVEPLKGFSWNAVLKPFKWYLWMVILLTICLSGCALYLIRKYTKKPDKQAAWNSCLWDVIVITCWDVIRSKQPRWCIILLLSSYMVGNFFLISEYMSSFTALMVSKSYISPPINNVQQLWASEMKWLGGRMTDY